MELKLGLLADQSIKITQKISYFLDNLQTSGLNKKIFSKKRVELIAFFQGTFVHSII